MASNLQRRKRGRSLFLTPVESESQSASTSSDCDSTATEGNGRWSPATTTRKTKIRATQTDKINNLPRSSSSPLIHNTQPQVSRHPPPLPVSSGNPDPRLRNSRSQTALTTLPRSRSGPQQAYYFSTSRYSGSDAEDDEDEDEEGTHALIFSSRSHFRLRNMNTRAPTTTSISPAVAQSARLSMRQRSIPTNLHLSNGHSFTSALSTSSTTIATPRPGTTAAIASKDISTSNKHATTSSTPSTTTTTSSSASTSVPVSSNPTVNSSTTKGKHVSNKHAIGTSTNGRSTHGSVNPDRIAPVLFQCLRVLAVIPALVETFSLLTNVFRPGILPNGNTRADYVAAAAWSILTGYQCLCFTTGLLIRWQHYYPLSATLVRLVALQAICWPATFYTLRFLQYDGVKRPLICWTVIGTTTCITRSVQMWVTSNIEKWYQNQRDSPYAHTVASIALGFGERIARQEEEDDRDTRNRGSSPGTPTSRSTVRRPTKRSIANGSATKVRKWDWDEVIWKCAFPAGVCYFFMAWALLLGRELYPPALEKC